MISSSDGERTPQHLNTKGVVTFALLGTLLFVTKMAMAALPNIEPVSLLVMVYTVVLGRRALYPIYVYVALECMVWGFNLWTISYLYVWAILAALSWVLRRMESGLGWAVLSGGFGLSFGALCALVYLAAGRWAFALSWWISGIPYDALHCAGNFAMALVLFKPCRKLLDKLVRQVGLVSGPAGREGS